MSGILARLQSALADRYRIERELSEGGMATVFLAQDLKHDRQVAIKVLKPELAAVLGAERFVVEIKTTAALQHPHILPLFDSGTADGFLFYVMPYVEGETLRAKLDRETQLGIDDAVRIARDVADALDYAHRHGVIHRDIKPENILLHDGRPMVADFGIALAVSAAAGGRMTETGLSLGTPHYMSPEQATAEKEISARSDVYSIGTVLYEMLAGNPPHTGASAQQIIMKIITEVAEPVTKYRKSVPANVAAAVAKSLEKLPADRFESAKAFADALSNPAFSTGAVSRGAPASSSGVRGGGKSSIVFAALTVIAIIFAAWGWLRPQPIGPVSRYAIQFPDVASELTENPMPIPAPDGSFIIFRGPQLGKSTSAQLWIKRRESRTPTPIDGTAQSQGFTLSPDGTQIAFVIGTRLLRVPVAGGSPTPLGPVDANGSFGMAWLENGTIAYSQAKARISVAVVPASGGSATTLISLDSNVRAIVAGAIGGTSNILYIRNPQAAITDLWAYEAGTKRSTLLLKGVSAARYVEDGTLLFAQSSRLMAVRFDPKRLTVIGFPVTLADSIITSSNTVFAAAPFEVSRSGMLLTRADATELPDPYEMVWVDRTGRMSSIDTTWHFSMVIFGGNHGWSLSPDGKRLAIGLNTSAGDDIWVKQLPNGALSRVSFDPLSDFRPRWAADGKSITYVSTRPKIGVYLRRADGLGSDSLLSGSNTDEAVMSPDGAWLVVRQGSNGSVSGGRDIRAVHLGVDTARAPLITTPFDEESMRFSPDGKWIAYQSDETGSNQVFVRSFPNVNAVKYQVSTGGAVAPLWSRDGRELFFVNGAREMVGTRVISAGAALSFGTPTVLFRIRDELLKAEYAFYTPWDVAADGRFIMARLRRTASANGTTFVVAENWLSELKSRMKK
jgi:serine/threonine protein kinase